MWKYGLCMIGGILRQGIFSKDEIIVSNLTEEGRARSEKTLGVVTTLDNNEIVRSAKTVVLAVSRSFMRKFSQRSTTVSRQSTPSSESLPARLLHGWKKKPVFL